MPPHFFLDHILFIPIVSWVVAHIVKVILRLQTRGFERKYLMSGGGMPSVHSAFMTSLASAIAVREGIDSAVFALSIAVTAIVLYDAMNVRYEAGQHARILNERLLQSEEKLTTHIGHTPMEVLIGSIVGIIVGFGLALV